MKTITTTIKRQWLAEIVAENKKIEYRELKMYWAKRLAIETPFRLRLINGMDKHAPEVTVLISYVDTGFQFPQKGLSRERVFRLHIAKVLSYKNWNKRLACPSTTTQIAKI